jgi:uncharacterized protein with PQ loop repeat
METVQETFGWIALGLSTITFLFPIPIYINVIKGKTDYESTPSYFLCSSYISYFSWWVYGDMIFSDQLKYCYIIGSLINACLILIYLFYELRKYLIDTILNFLILVTGSWALYRALTIIIDDDVVVGKICLGTTIVVHFNSVHTIYKVIKDKSYLLIQLYNCCATILAGVCWSIYGIMISDVYMVLANIVAGVICLVQIIIYFNYKRKYPSISEKSNNPTIGIESGNQNDIGKKEESPLKTDESKIDVEKPVKIVDSI